MPREKNHNRPYLTRFRKRLRNEGTKAEAIMWTYLKQRQLGGFKFRRQHSVGNYILDFYCPKKKLAIELDGAYHFTIMGIIKDTQRDEWLGRKGIKVLRFENKLLFENPDQVLEKILQELNRVSSCSEKFSE